MPAPVASTNPIIPDDLPKLDGTLTRSQRVLIAQDVIVTLSSKQRRIEITRGSYFHANNPKKLPTAGEFHSSKIIGGCKVCALGALFLASVDRLDKCNMSKYRDLSNAVIDRTYDEWGDSQATLIESCFEFSADYNSPARALSIMYLEDYPRDLLLAICENIIANHGEFKPETSL